MFQIKVVKRTAAAILSLLLILPSINFENRASAEEVLPARLTGLTVSDAVLLPAFDPARLDYRAEVSESVEAVNIIPAAEGSTITVNNETVSEGAAGKKVPLTLGDNLISVTCSAAGQESVTYQIKVIRQDRQKLLVELADNITKSYANTADAWRILDTVYYLGRENAKVDLTAYKGFVDTALAKQDATLGTISTAGLVLTALGNDVTAYQLNGTSVNLIERIEKSGGYKNTDGSFNLFNAAAALYALDSSNYTVSADVDAIVKSFLDTQYADGGWGFDGVNGDVDTTAMCVTALAPYREKAEVANAINNAVSFLSNTQCKSGGYSSFGAENSNTIEMAIIALTSLGIDVGNDARFIKNGSNMIDALLTYKTAACDGFGFTDSVYNSYATEQGLRALAAYLRFIKLNKPQSGCSPYDFADFQGTVSDNAAQDTNLISLTANGGAVTPGFDAAVSSYKYETADSNITINAAPQNSKAALKINNQPAPQTVSLSYGTNTIEISVTSEDGKSEKAYTIDVNRTGGSENPTAQSITLKILGHDGQKILPETDVRFQSGDTPYGVLKRTAAAHNIDVSATGSGSSVYIIGIDGLNELDYGARSGWMYSVNGTFYQKSAGTFALKAGDVLCWEYTEELGIDIGGGFSGSTEKTVEQENTETEASKISAMISETQKKINLTADTSVWGLYSLARLNAKPASEIIAALKEKLTQFNGEFRKITDAAGLLLAVSAAGLDAHSFADVDLVDKLTNSDRMLNQGINGPIFTLIALDSRDYSTTDDALWTRDLLIKEILNAQNDDGGLPLTKSETSNPDITAMAITALSKYSSRQDVNTALSAAVSFLSKSQLDNGGFALYKQENCESTVQVIIALSAMGIDSKNDERFIKGKKSPIDMLLSYRLKDGSFSHISGGEADDMATEQALIALMAYNRYLTETGSVYDLLNVSKAVFSDAWDISQWAFDSVTKANELKIMNGNGGVFRPKADISRAELAQILTRLLGLKSGETHVAYNDVASNSWYADAVSAVSSAGIMCGKSDTEFKPDAKLTREEFAVIIYRVLSLSPSGAETFSDFKNISEWARGAVGAVNDKKIMLGSNGSFRPKDAVSREMAATICIRLQNLLK